MPKKTSAILSSSSLETGIGRINLGEFSDNRVSAADKCDYEAKDSDYGPPLEDDDPHELKETVEDGEIAAAAAKRTATLKENRQKTGDRPLLKVRLKALV